MDDAQRMMLDGIREEIVALRESNVDLHSVCARVDERLEGIVATLDSRLDHHSRQNEDTAKHVAEIEHTLTYVKAWSAGAGVAVTVTLSALAWLLSRIPSDAWQMIGRH